jgi:hypothetical protein
MRFATRQSYVNNSGAVRALCNGNSCYYSYNRHIHTVHICAKPNPTYAYGHCYKSVKTIQVRPPGYFTHIYINTPIVTASKNYYI